MKLSIGASSKPVRLTTARCALSSIVVIACLSGCASHSGIRMPEAVRGEIAGAASTDLAPAERDDLAPPPRMLRRAAGVAQAGVLYARSVHIDPLNRPVSNLLSLSSFVFKSTTGLLRRTALGVVQFPSLENQPIPPVAYRKGMDLQQWENDLDRISGQKRSQGTIDFLVGGEEYFTRLLESFAQAEDSIDIRTYIFDNDDYAVYVADYLKDRSRDVRVRVMFDGMGNLLATQADADSVPRDFEAPLSISRYLEDHSNVDVRSRANPWLTGDHTKTTIVDRKVAFVGGMNIGREYRYDWHDLMMEVRGPIVDELQFESDKAWARAGIFGDVANFLRFLAGKKQHADVIGYPIRPLYTRNFDSQIYRAQLAAIRRSQSYIIIENAYFSDDRIMYELARARRRGVDVRVILPTAGNHGPLNASNQVAINKMLDNGIRVYLFPGMNHVKAAIFDGWACVGSANFDKLSLEINKELNLSTSHPEAVEQLLDRVFIPDLARSEEVTDMLELTLQARLLEVAVDELL